MEIKVLGVRTDGTTELLHKDADDLAFYSKYVGAQVEHYVMGQWHDAGRGYLIAWIDEWGTTKPECKLNTIVTSLAGIFGRQLQPIRGDAVISWDYAATSADIPEYIVHLVKSIAEVHRKIGFTERR